MSSLLILSPTSYLSTSSKLEGVCDGLSVGVRGSFPASRISSWPKIQIFHVSTQLASLVHSSRVENVGISDPLWYLEMSHVDRGPMEPSIVGAEGSDRASESGYEVGSVVGFSLGGPSSGVGSA